MFRVSLVLWKLLFIIFSLFWSDLIPVKNESSNSTMYCSVIFSSSTTSVSAGKYRWATNSYYKVCIALISPHNNIYITIIHLQCSNGIVRGKYVDAGRGNRVSAFLGIPYAKPPVKELRFAAPEPSRPWNSMLEATKYGPACFHEDDTFFRGFEGWEFIFSVIKTCLEWRYSWKLIQILQGQKCGTRN